MLFYPQPIFYANYLSTTKLTTAYIYSFIIIQILKFSLHSYINMFDNKNSQISAQNDQIPDFKKKRDEDMESMRKTNRAQIFSKRRNILTGDGHQPLGSFEHETPKKDKLLIVDQNLRSDIENYLRQVYTMDSFPHLVTSIIEGDIKRQHFGMIGIRKILSVADNPPIQAVIDAGLVPRMIQYVKQTSYPQLQLQATWALTNVASGTTIQCQSIIDKGGIPLFVELLKSSSKGIVEQAIWAIGNISSDCVFYRDTIIRAGGLINLIQVMDQLTDPTLIKHACWAISNLCRGSPLPKYQNIKLGIPVLCKYIASDKLKDRQIIADCCWAISYHSDANKNKIQAVIETGVIQKIVSYLNESAIGLLVPSVRIIGNISTGNFQQTNQLMKYDILTPIEKILDHHKKVVRRQACWVLSNISAGSKYQTDALLSRQNLIKKLLEMFETDCNEVRKEICFIFSNLSHCGDPQKIFNLYCATNIIRYYVNLLTVTQAKAVQNSLECLFIILGHGQKFKANKKNPFIMQLHKLNAIQILQKLQYHKSELVYENVSKILQTYFQIQDPLDL